MLRTHYSELKTAVSGTRSAERTGGRTMMKGTLLSTVATVAFIFGTAIVGQERADFSGTWVMDMSRSETPAQAADASPRKPVRLLISSSAEALVIERHGDGRPQLLSYSYSKPDFTDQPVGTSGSDSTAVERAFAKWENGRLETLTVLRISGQMVTRKATHSLDSAGREMTVVTETVIHHGYEGRGGGDKPGNRGAVKDVYVKSDH